MEQYQVTSSIKFLDFLKTIYPESSLRTLQTWIKAGRFFTKDRPLKRGDSLLEEGEILFSKKTSKDVKIQDLKILYEDRYLIVVDKPTGLLSVPLDEGSDIQRNVLRLLKTHFKSDGIFPVHRIDKDASGTLLFARGKDSESRLKKLFETHDLRREYFAIVQGRLMENKGIWKSKLEELPTYFVVESANGKESITHFEVLRRSAKYTYLKLRLETGRKHQIRVHCQRAGHPILGDKKYGSLENPIKRLCLHAILLEFVHPYTQKKILFESSIPQAFKKLGAQ